MNEKYPYSLTCCNCGATVDVGLSAPHPRKFLCCSCRASNDHPSLAQSEADAVQGPIGTISASPMTIGELHAAAVAMADAHHETVYVSTTISLDRYSSGNQEGPKWQVCISLAPGGIHFYEGNTAAETLTKLQDAYWMEDEKTSKNEVEARGFIRDIEEGRTP
ncbi:MAG: hypothetical protein V3S43_06165 [Acidimicrobiia bacterium]